MVTSECCFCVRRLTALSALALTCLVFGANGVMHESPEKNPGCIGPETAFSLYGSTRRGWSNQLTFDTTPRHAGPSHYLERFSWFPFIWTTVLTAPMRDRLSRNLKRLRQ